MTLSIDDARTARDAGMPVRPADRIVRDPDRAGAPGRPQEKADALHGRAMGLQRQVSRRLHEEHLAILDLLGRFAPPLARLQGAPQAPDEALWRTLLAQLAGALEHEVTRHFALEEEQLFPRLRARGESDLADLLLEEHEAIRAVARPLLALILAARTGELDAAGWRALKPAGLELVERLESHALKEEGALVPLVDEMLDEATDDELFAAYALS